ncbi:MAG: V-type ATP synthase subunit F [Nitrososphaerales archaeon]
MKVVAIGSRGFVTGFELAGMSGVKVDTPEQAFSEIQNQMSNSEVALILVSDDLSKPIHDKLTEIRTKKPMPLVYEIPAPGSKREKVEYRDMLKSILGV